MLSPSSSTRSAASRLMSRRALLLGGAATLMAGCASDIRPLSEEAPESSGSVPPPRPRARPLLRLVRRLLPLLPRRPHQQALRSGLAQRGTRTRI